MAIGRLVHIGVDIVLVSMVLAGTRRSTGLAPALGSQGGAVQNAVKQYIDMGDYVLGYAERQMASSSLFKRS
ncbi:hypothetical protein GGF46_000492 [Coemansia sp. RSA 552]|nr:hypothetical protein GGF46_000492 [Coemansia sp. RSA 552]